MKPAAAISLVVIAVLATVVVEETRIKQLQAELNDLRALRNDEPPAPAAPTSAATPDTEQPLLVTPAIEPPAVSPAPTGRQLPDDFPAPDADRIHELAMSDRADLYLTLGVDAAGQAYIEDVLLDLQLQRQQFAARWLEADAQERVDIEADLNDAALEAGEKIAAYFNNEDDFETFQSGLDRQPDRDLYKQLAPYLAVQGVNFEKAKEDRFIEALHEIRSAVGGIDWNSPDALPYVASGEAGEKFRAEWNKMNEALGSVLPVFLSEKEIEAVTAARKELYESLRSSFETEAPTPDE